MSRPAYLYWYFLLFSISNSSTTSQTTSEINNANFTSEKDASLNDQECSLYMAPSSIPGAGYGIFITRTVQEKEDILPYSDAPSIVVCDYEQFDVKVSDWSHSEYFWAGGGLSKFECESASESVMTIGALSNYHVYLTNIKGVIDGYDDLAADRFVNPSAGAFSYHKGHHFIASRTITAGEEIFADYGEKWLTSRGGTFADKVPRGNDFVTAGNILRTIRESFLESAIVINDKILSLFKDSAGILDDRVASLIPSTKAQYDSLTENHLDEDEHYANAIAKSSVITREVDWIKENGLCMDNISPRKSTIPLIGQGAFANRFLVEGSRISPVPLIQILNSDKMLMYGVRRDKENNELHVEYEPNGKQLLLNYCFGHIDSKLLLCPQSNAILINHCSSRRNGGGQCGINGPNAKIRWANGWDPDTPVWLEMSMNQLSAATAAKSRGLSLEVVATRDIQTGEEIFLDYGPNWEDAWELHKNTWKPPTEASGFKNYNPLSSVSAKAVLRTINELEDNPYPNNIITACYWYEYVAEGYGPDEMGYYMANDYIYEGDIETSSELLQCDILKKVSDTHYEVRILRLQDGLDDVLLTMFPRESITFRMKQYTGDQYLPGAFRHFIEIEDNIFPKQWKTSFDDA